MAEKKPVSDKKNQFENAVYDLGLSLIDDYRNGAYRPNGGSRELLEAITEIFKHSKENDKRGE